MPKAIAVIATCDTKGTEAKYIKEQIEKHGKNVILIDVGIKGEPVEVIPDITHYQITENIGLKLTDVQNAPSQGEAVSLMSEALKKCLLSLYYDDKIVGVLCVAGAGIFIAVPGMQLLPFGVPKLVVTPLASGTRQFEPFIGSSDMLVMHSVIDILGINPISQKIFDNAVGAIVGMVEMNECQIKNHIKPKNLIGITMYGSTTPGVMAAKKILENAGYECIMFHASGVGGRAMENLIKEGFFVGILDYTLSEMVGQWIDGFTKCNSERLSVAGEFGLPQVIVPGCVDFINIFPNQVHLEPYNNRLIYNHNPQYPLVRTTKDEEVKLAKIIADKLNKAKGPVEILLPLKGLSAPNHSDGPFWDPDADAAFRRSLKESLKSNVKVKEIEAHINDKICGEEAAKILINMLNYVN